MNTIESLLTLNTLSGITGFAVTIGFGIWLLKQPTSQNLNVASWVMWALLDAVLVTLTYKAGKPAHLFIGWTLAAALVAGGILWKGATWKMDFGSWASVIGVILSTYFWATDDSSFGLYACAVAMFVAGIPQILNFLKEPARNTWWLWAGTSVACVIAILGTETVFTPGNAPALSSLLFQAVVLTVLFRGSLFR